MDIFDKETRKLFYILIFLFIGIFILIPFTFANIDTSNIPGSINRIVGNLYNFINITFIGGEIPPKPNNFEIEKNKDYKLIIDTDQGKITIDLFESDAYKNVSNIVYLSKHYNNATFYVTKDYLIKVQINKKINYNIEDEINADRLKLDQIKVKDADFLKDLHKTSDYTSYAFTPENLSKHSEFSLKEFYSEIIGYQYKEDINTPKAVKYIVYMANTGPNTNKGDFFILMANSAPEIDGRYTPIGRVIEGFNTLDLINQKENSSSIKIKSISISY